ncbi:SMP-30/gluconolactonase/LRE family protein [Mesorhizobium koreense]|uniref:SMP-30/gluconolactonase/LRE family protein n=1 Tax=Mesorhizobium koreense TaxID=3074855 RepID=UPI00287B6E67|nr:SMP-30/gluconolactonase/LRE family protein [Mesorhizobium sp. WR6]
MPTAPKVSHGNAEVHVAAQCGNVLGESPVWSEREQVLYWTDIRAPALFRLDIRSGEVARWPMPELAGSVVLRETGGVIVGLQSGLYSFDLGTKSLSRTVHFPTRHPQDRTNDARCDREGRLWFSRMRDFGKASTGGLYRLDASGDPVELISGVTIPNAICFSPDGRRFYFADTPKESLDAFEMTETDVSFRRLGAVVPAGLIPGRPDGATVDSEGYLWNARFDGGCIVRSAPDGSAHVVYPLPVSRPTSCSFGGNRLDRLYITTARQGLDAAALAAEPLAGALLAIDPGVRGLTEPGFAG